MSIAVANDLEPVDHWCHQGSEYANVSSDAWKELYLPRRPDGRGYDKCHRYEAPLAAPLSAASEVRSVAFSWAYTFGRLGAMTAEAFRVAESMVRYDMGALPIGVAALNLLVFSLLLLTLSDRTLLDIVTRVDTINAAGAPPPVKKRRILPDSLFQKQ